MAANMIFGTSTISDIYFGNDTVKKIYFGNSLVWEKAEPTTGTRLLDSDGKQLITSDNLVLSVLDAPQVLPST